MVIAFVPSMFSWHASSLASLWHHLLSPWVEAIAGLHGGQCSSEVQHVAKPPLDLALGLVLLEVDGISYVEMKMLKLASVLIHRHLRRPVMRTSST